MIVHIIFLTLLGIQASNAHALTPRILNGRLADYEKFKSIARVVWGARFVKDADFGAGVVLNPHWVLTAAHIIKSFPCCGTTKVRVGDFEKMTNEKNLIQTVKIETRIAHENYRGHLKPYDLGLLGTNETIILGNGHVSAAVLPVEYSVHRGKVYMAGWGNTRVGILVEPSKNLRSVEVPTLNSEECQPYIDDMKINEVLIDSQMCTYNSESNPVPLNGDGGGPLIVHKDNQEEVVGIISWIFNSDTKVKFPSVHTRVSPFVSWIHNKMSQYIVRNWKFQIKGVNKNGESSV